MRFSSYSRGSASDDIERLRESGEIQYEQGYIGCCRRYFLIFPNDQRKYYYNPNKLISDSLYKKVFKYLYSPYNNMNKRLNRKIHNKRKQKRKKLQAYTVWAAVTYKQKDADDRLARTQRAMTIKSYKPISRFTATFIANAAREWMEKIG